MQLVRSAAGALWVLASAKLRGALRQLAETCKSAHIGRAPRIVVTTEEISDSTTKHQQILSEIRMLDAGATRTAEELAALKRTLDTLAESTASTLQVRGRVFAILFFSLFFLGSLMVGVHLKPELDFDATLQDKFQVGLPLVISDGASLLKVRRVSWTESHGEDIDRFYPVNSDDIPRVEHGHTRIILTVHFEKPATKDAAIKMNFTLPADGTLHWCSDPSDEHSSPSCDPRLQPEEERLEGRPTQIDIAGNVKQRSNAFTVHVDISGVSGINFAATRTRALIRFPRLVALPPFVQAVPRPPGASDAVAAHKEVRTLVVETGALLPGADQVNWTVQPPNTDSDFVGWTEEVQTSSMPPGSIAGVREQVLRDDAEDNFGAGLALGMSGAALLAIFQVLFDLWHQPTPSRQRRS